MRARSPSPFGRPVRRRDDRWRCGADEAVMEAMMQHVSYVPGSGCRYLVALVLTLVLLAACATPQRGATPVNADPARSVVRQDDYAVTLALVPLTEIGEAAVPGAIGGVGYRLEVAGPVAARISLETFRLSQPGV